jgi:hypothetical protein
MGIAGLVIIAWLIVNLLAAVSLEALIMPGIFTILWLVMWFRIANTETATIQIGKQ